jgi:hypothetical protein
VHILPTTKILFELEVGVIETVKPVSLSEALTACEDVLNVSAY